MLQKSQLKKLALLSLAGLFGFQGKSHGSAVAIKLESARAAGMAHAGSGVVDDPMASFVNPAAMVLNQTHHLGINSTAIIIDHHFKGTGRKTVGGVGIHNQTRKTGNAGILSAVPSSGLVLKLGERLRLGIAVATPYGNGLNYKASSPTRYFLTKGTFKTVNITPSVALRINDIVSVGGGFQAQWSEFLYQKMRAFNTTTLRQVPFSTKIDDWSYGWTAGVLFELTPAWKLSFSYRSRLLTHLKGTTKSSVLDGKSDARIALPDTFYASTSLKLTPCWTYYMDVIRTLWGSVNKLDIHTLITRSNLGANAPVGSRSTTTIVQNYKHTWFISGGLEHKWDEKWTFRGGYGYDKSAVGDTYRTPGIPDQNRHWLAGGATFTMNKWSATMSYGFELFRRARINLNEPLGDGTLLGNTSTHVHLVSLQLNYRF